MFGSGNPVLAGEVYSNAAVDAGDHVMTVQGAATKTLLLVLTAVVGAAFVWSRFFAGQDVTPWLVLGGVGGTILALVTIFVTRSAPWTSIPYAAFEGLTLGGLSAMFEQRYPGIVIQAVGLTFGTLFALLLAYKARIVRATQGFRMGLIAAMGAISLLYLVDLIMMIFGHRMPFIHESGLIGIGFSLFVVGIAALSLVLDFDRIERGAESGAPKYMEWYSAFGLLLTLVWLYIEVLRLLAKLQDGSRRRSS